MADLASPLAGLLPTTPPAEAQLWAIERPFLARVWLRGRAGDAGFRAAVARVLGDEPPADPLRVAAHGPMSAIRLAPDAWVVLGPAGEGAALAARFAHALADVHAAALDMSSARTVVRLGGAQASDLLATGCALDLDPSVFVPGHAAQTRLGNTSALIVRQPDDPPAYDLHVPRSTAESFLVWLRHAGREFGLTA